MKGNTILNKAKYTHNTDEWYTDYKTVYEEVTQYKNHFAGKIVLCNCDDPYESSFTKYFLKHFNFLKLKKLICTSYKGSRIIQNNAVIDSVDVKLDNRSAYVLIVDNISGKLDAPLSDRDVKRVLEKEGNVKQLNGDGDFLSKECVEYLKEADIVVTNPPFSKFTQLFTLLIKHDKKYLLIGNQNAITYKDVFPHIKNGEAWIGYRFGDMAFKVPDDTPPRKTRFWIDENGQKWRSLGNAMWLTNLDNERKHKDLKLTCSYDPEKHPKYDNYDAINVSKVSEIPMNYAGIMGVPLTFLKYHNEDQFEIIGEANHGSDNEFDLFKPIVNGKELFKRILIKSKEVFEKTVNYKILDLFCGAGGMSHGMHKNPHFRTEVALDINERLALTLKKNMPDVDVITGDILNDFVKEKVINSSIKRGVNMIIGGPPCQGYSMKGKKLGLKDPRNFLFIEFLNIVKRIQPEIFVIENVKSLLSTSKGWFKDEITAEIEKLGYHFDFGILKASDFGVPQTRERAIFICCKTKKIRLPLPTVKHLVTVKDAIYDLAYLESNEGEFEQDYLYEANSEYQKEMRENSNKLYNHKASNHASIAIEKLKMIPPEKGKEYLPKELLGKQQFKSTWGRLKWDKPSPTIDTRFDAASNGTNNHPFLHRTITPREAARLQSFDDNYIFYGPKVAVRAQIGNAVPPLMAKAIADKIFKELNNTK